MNYFYNKLAFHFITTFKSDGINAAVGKQPLQSRFFIFTINVKMNFKAKNIFGVFCLGAFFLTAACSTNESVNQNKNSPANQTNAAQQQATKDDVEELGKIIRLNIAPEEATYRVEANDKKITAVLKFSTSDAAQIVASAQKYKPAAQTEIETEDWFPAELVAQSQLSGDENLRGAMFAADDFFQPPFTSGKLTRVGDTDYFILELAAP